MEETEPHFVLQLKSTLLPIPPHHKRTVYHGRTDVTTQPNALATTKTAIFIFKGHEHSYSGGARYTLSRRRKKKTPHPSSLLIAGNSKTVRPTANKPTETELPPPPPCIPLHQRRRSFIHSFMTPHAAQRSGGAAVARRKLLAHAARIRPKPGAFLSGAAPAHRFAGRLDSTADGMMMMRRC